MPRHANGVEYCDEVYDGFIGEKIKKKEKELAKTIVHMQTQLNTHPYKSYAYKHCQYTHT